MHSRWSGLGRFVLPCDIGQLVMSDVTNMCEFCASVGFIWRQGMDLRVQLIFSHLVAFVFFYTICSDVTMIPASSPIQLSGA